MLTKKEFNKIIAEALDYWGEEGILKATIQARKAWNSKITVTMSVAMYARAQLAILEGALKCINTLWKARKELGV